MRTLIFAAAVALLPTIGAAQEAVTGAAADLRVLDKLNGVVTDISLRDGERNRVVRYAKATFEASVAVLNMLSPKKAAPMATP